MWLEILESLSLVYYEYIMDFLTFCPEGNFQIIA